ncbi:UDP-N-acetylenolpyruvoylglucosamine reductase [Candidatus Uhrbacteria bacterium RIFCSPLOWO2_01_FULL_53_9]|uniref:UDP-N-acetylenolpyruvoylglucosamine reductase n=3 Tax=Candidatus Uhriibacteriota TaxID=1752732 RepID=A0A1F7UZT7_9BACT|nr:MAG: UDP-N-acetylenolpyruvoylglucosamine reductase [Candidatus Uhrbacteria bacterium RIFCSPHIGHO2_02_FULL_53_13]OGL83308.1 MAG: UDP-N-acetylenolpyruvoylglucosamine reductase [Candidatus Uhrbacteria bacterium RIFCSPLOWO2_01_FULL_53_9]OGL90181.1 MAG: UDP-N-acetylenolpyruvoylglucosamine reductase [Candidatus Uhrbacteria bacterium RIFCSPLOWO2_02_FULL_53_10]
MNPFISHLENIVGDRLRFNEPLSQFSHYAVGGPARYVVEAKTSEEVEALVAAAQEHHVPWVVLGGGTNILPSDHGFDGLVIRMANRSVQLDAANARVTAEAGALASSVARKTADAGLSGLEWAISLPGTMGGAVRGNAGCFGGEVKDTFLHAWVLDPNTGKMSERKRAWFKFGYRESRVKHESGIVLRATFQLIERPVEETKEKVNYVLNCRLTSQPKNAKCAGCAFKNFEYERGDEIKKLRGEVADIPQNFIDQKRIPAGWLIERADLKGTRVGGAYISEEHGNFLINDGTATADHIAQLIALVKTRVRDRFGIQLQEEVQYIGWN